MKAPADRIKEIEAELHDLEARRQWEVSVAN
jgi:hypothetical protein